METVRNAHADTKVSLVIRTLNEETNIGDCLSALEIQTHRPDEILIVDNQSTDRTVEIALTFSDRFPIRIIENPIRGYSSGLNIGIEHSHYDIVGFLSADCVPEKNWLKELKKTLVEEKCAVAEGIQIYEPENDVNFVLSTERTLPKDTARASFFSNTNVLYQKSILLKYLPFRDLSDQGGEDAEMSIKYARDNLFVFLNPRAIVHHRQFENLDKFKERMFKHGRLSVAMLLNYPLYPRTYLNAFYWSLYEFLFFLIKQDVRYLKIAYTRCIYTLRGAASTLFRFSHN